MLCTCSTCGRSTEIQSRSLRKNLRQNNGAYRCQSCYFSSMNGRQNPNSTYEINDGLFSGEITSELAYLLGWIASDGHVRKDSVTIEIHSRDSFILEQLRPLYGPNPAPVRRRKDRAILTVCSKQVVSDVCRILRIEPGKKAKAVQFPQLPEEVVDSFMRGYFDGDGGISSDPTRSPRASITSLSPEMIKGVEKWSLTRGFSCHVYGQAVVEWTGIHAVDMLSRLYQEASLYLPRKRDEYLDLCLWQPSLLGMYANLDGIQVNRTRKDAVLPSKARASDSGYDLTVLECVKKFGLVEVYDTGIKVKPPEGFYFDLVARSSITKTGYVLANSVGVIDRSYRGPVMIALLKVDPQAPPLPLPMRIAQLIPRPIVHFEVQEVDELDSTDRGAGGFGSTGQ